MLFTREEREKIECERQISAIRDYNRRKRNVYDSRLNKFLTLYPYEGRYDVAIIKFKNSVANADEEKLNSLIEFFNEENKYWSSYYVLNNCNTSIHQHIMNILTLMHDSLSVKIQEVANETDSVCDNDGNDNPVNS